MRTILIAHRDITFSAHLAAELRQAGYRVIECPGPWPPKERCIRCDTGYCPLTEGADLMIYDPQLTALDAAGRRYNLAVDSALAHPDVPMLLAWSPRQPAEASSVGGIQAEVPSVQVAAEQPVERLQQIQRLLAMSAGVAP
jgi:hypothetical protein